MKVEYYKRKVSKWAFALLIPTCLSVTGCSEDIDESNLYTFTGETIESYLTNRDSVFSNFNEILKVVGHDKMLSAYGNYTLFAPTNKAVEDYIDSLCRDNKGKFVSSDGITFHNGIVDSSEWQPGQNAFKALMSQGTTGNTAKDALLLHFRDSLCKDIAEFHILTSKFMAVDMGSGVTVKTLLGRNINTSINTNGATCVNVDAQITNIDNEVENGVVHELNHVITRSNRLMAGEMEQHKEYSMFYSALTITGLADSLVQQRKTGLIEIKKDYSFFVPKECLVGYTIFAETDETLKQKGINTFEDLVAHANETYAHAADEGSGWYDYARNTGKKISTGTDYTNPWNCLNMFIRYHIIKASVPLDKLTYSFNETAGQSLFEYYETMLPFTLLKVSKVSQTHVINRWITNSSLTDRPSLAAKMTPNKQQLKYEGAKITGTVSPSPLNGNIHSIDDILEYKAFVPQGVLNERMRFDDTALFPEMMTNQFRGALDDEIKALNNGTTGKDGELAGAYIRFPENYFDHMKIYNGEGTRVYYLPGRSNGWSNYQGDEYNCMGAYDFALRLPPVPDGTYELRIGFTANGNRGMLQFSLGRSANRAQMKALDIPLDMRIQGDNPLIGWTDYAAEADNGVETDKAMHNRGYMRGPLYYTLGKGGSTRARSNRQDLRRIVARQQFEQGEYWLRFKTVLPENTTTQFHLDYIEFCPSTVYNNALYTEDMY